MIHPPHTGAADAAVPRPGWPHQLALGAPVLLPFGRASGRCPRGVLSLILGCAVVEAAQQICAGEPLWSSQAPFCSGIRPGCHLEPCRRVLGF